MSDHSMFSHLLRGRYVDNILSECDCVGIIYLKLYLSYQFHTKDLGTLRYFWNRVARSKVGMYLSQRKYVLDLLSETGILDSRRLILLWIIMSSLMLTWESYLRMLDSIDSWLGSLFTLLLHDHTSHMWLE